MSKRQVTFALGYRRCYNGDSRTNLIYACNFQDYKKPGVFGVAMIQILFFCYHKLKRKIQFNSQLLNSNL